MLCYSHTGQQVFDAMLLQPLAISYNYGRSNQQSNQQNNQQVYSTTLCEKHKKMRTKYFLLTYFLHGFTVSFVISNPANSTSSWANRNLSGLMLGFW